MAHFLAFFQGFADSSFARLFTEMQVLPIILFVLGIIFCAVEMFIPGFGFFGISGVILIVAGIVVRFIQDGDLLMLLYMILIAFLLLFLMFFVLSRAIRKGRLGKTAIFSVDSSVAEDKTEGTRDFAFLVGQTGVTETMLRPVGKATFGGEVIDVVAREGFIDKGEKVTCISTEGQRVVVVSCQTKNKQRR